MSRFTTRAVAERVGISDGTLFRHFGNKREIVLEAMTLLGADISTSLVDTGDAHADLQQFFGHRAAFVGAQGSVGRLIFSDELVHLAGDQGRECVSTWRRQSVGYLLERLRRLRRSGKLRTDLDLPAMGMLIQGTLLTFAMQASLGRAGSQDELESRIEHAWKALHTVLFKN